MLAVNKYPKEYIAGCRAKVASQVSTYQVLLGTVSASANGAVELFEQDFFRHMVLVLDHYFVNRTRNLEGKDGNPLNEVRMLCNAIMLTDNVLSGDKTIKYTPERSVLKYAIGDEVKLTREQFSELSEAYFKEIEARFS
jgi:hypothetical protein